VSSDSVPDRLKVCMHMIVASVPGEAVVMRLRTRFRLVLRTQMVFRWLSFCRQASLSCSGGMEPVRVPGDSKHLEADHGANVQHFRPRKEIL
jgi:hypothetical protein